MANPDPGLLNVVRQRMAEQSTDELLRIWVENDRFQWSPETFEAVRSVLAERGVELPPQNDPPPLAAKRDPLKDVDPATAYWLVWLRPVLFIGLVLGGMELVEGVWFLRFHVGYFREFSTHEWLYAAWSEFGSLLLLVATLCVAMSLLLGSWWALRLRPAGRKLLLVYCFASFARTALLLRDSIHTGIEDAKTDAVIYPWYNQVEMWVWYLYGLAYPLILLLFLRRREIKLLFHPALVAFEVKPELAPTYNSTPPAVRVDSASPSDQPATKE
jgi:hypothetical protein